VAKRFAMGLPLLSIVLLQMWLQPAACGSSSRLSKPGDLAIDATPVAAAAYPSPAVLLEQCTASAFELFKSDADLKKFVDNNVGFKKELFEKLAGLTGDKDPVVLVSAGSFSTPTTGHLQLLEDAKKAVEDQGKAVIRGFLSPVHMNYGKSSLVPCYHRVNMLASAVKSYTWLQVNPWECTRDGWTKTADLLQHIQTEISDKYPKARVMLVGGADLLESLATIRKENGKKKAYWYKPEVMLQECGVVISERDGTDVHKVIQAIQHNGDLLLGGAENVPNIITFKPSKENVMSSSLVREALQKRSMYEDTAENKPTQGGFADYINDAATSASKELKSVVQESDAKGTGEDDPAGVAKYIKYMVPPGVAEYIEEYNLEKTFAWQSKSVQETLKHGDPIDDLVPKDIAKYIYNNDARDIYAKELEKAKAVNNLEAVNRLEEAELRLRNYNNGMAH